MGRPDGARASGFHSDPSAADTVHEGFAPALHLGEGVHDPLDQALEDDTLLEEIALLVGVILAAGDCGRSLSPDDVDRALGLT